MSVGMEGGFAHQLENVRQRLAALQNLLADQINLNQALQQRVIVELQAALDILQSVQLALQGSSIRGEAAQIERLQNSLREKEILLREIHHRVKNNFQLVASLLDIQAIRTVDPSVQELLKNNQSRVNAIALVHDRLSQATDLSEISLGDYIQSLATTLMRAYVSDTTQVTLITEIAPNVIISPDRAIPIGLILNEFISNALKHGIRTAGGLLSVQLESNEQLTLSVRNTGNPLPVNFNPSTADSLGFQLIRSLVQQINGTLEFERQEQTTFRIKFPLLG
jgi:two-component system, sensor histidine kinase PdtaS